MTIDFHQHLWPESFCAALTLRSEPPFLRGTELITPEGRFVFDPAAHDPKRRIALLDRDEIDIAVVSLQPSLGLEELESGVREELEIAWIDGMRELVGSTDGRFRALAPWRVVPGFAGVSVGASAVSDLAVGAGVLAAAEAAGVVVFVHPESEGALPEDKPEWWHWSAGYTGQMQRSYLTWLSGGRARHPSLKIVFAMLAGGAPFHHERLTHRGVDVRTTLDPDTLFETSTYGRRAIELVIETFGVERLVYGSDVPVVDPRLTLRAVRGLGDSVARLLQSDTPERLMT